MIDYSPWEVIKNGNSFPKTQTVEGFETVMPITFAEDKEKRRLEIKARSTLMMGIPNAHQLKFNSIKDAKSLLEAIKKSFGVWRNKPDLDSMSMDDLYNNLKVYEPKVIGVSSSSTNTQNMAFVSSSSINNINNINEAVNTAFGVTIAGTQVNAANSTNINILSDTVICEFLASQSNSSQLINKDLDQIHPDDLEEMDLKWQMAMLTIRARRFLKNTGRKLNLNRNDTVAFDKTKVEYSNSHKRDHFGRECRAPRAQDNRNIESTRRNVPVETTSSLALVSCNGLGGYDWSDQAEDGPNYALMAYSTSSSDSEKGLGYNAVPPPHTGLSIPPKPNLSYIGLEEFTSEPVVKTLSAKTNEEVPKVVKKDNGAPIIKDWKSDDEDESVSQPKIEKKIVQPSVAKPVVAGTQSNGNAGTKDNNNAGQARKEKVPSKDYILLPLWTTNLPFPQELKSSQDAGFKPFNDVRKKVNEVPRKENKCKYQKEKDSVNSTNRVNAVSLTVNAASNEVNTVGRKSSIKLSYDPNMPKLEDINIFKDSNEDVFGAEADLNNLESTFQVSPIRTTRVHKDHPLKQVIEDMHLAPQTRRMTKNLEEHGLVNSKSVFRNELDERGIVIRNKARLVAQRYTQEKGIEYEEVFAPFARIEAIRLFLAYASFKDFVVYQMDVKSAFLYGKIEKEIYVCQPLGFEDPDFPDKVYKVEKALYGLHQAPRAWYETLSTYLLDNGFHRGKIDKTLFTRRHKDDILLVQVYVDDIIFGSTKKESCNAFEKLTHDTFQMSFIGELTFFLGLQVKQKEDGIFINQDKYVAKILKKFGFSEVKTASTPVETQKPLLKDKDGEEVDAHIYRSMIGSLMYLTPSRPDIMFAYKKQIVVANSTTKAEYVAAFSCCGQFWTTVKSKIVNEEVHMHALVDGMKRTGKGFSGKETPLFPTMVGPNKVQVSEGSAQPIDTQHTPTFDMPPPKPKKTQKLRNPRERPLRATTTAPSLEAGQNSGDGPRCQDTMRDTSAHTRYEIVSKMSSDSLLKVLDLEDELNMKNTAQQTKIDFFKRRVKKLEKKHRSRTHKLKRWYKVGLTARVISSSDNEALDKEDTSKHGMINEIDANEDIAIVSTHDDVVQDEGIEDVGEEEVVEVVTSAKMIVDAAQVTTAPTITDESTKTNVENILYYLLIEKMYPLTHHTLNQIFNNVKIQVEYKCEMAYELLRLVKKQLKEGYRANSSVWMNPSGDGEDFD
uniref:Retrovirus-related Pol polyprotein from transposon TNT 1-94 n=1 Tax=Tanacetum cinerariifolium TaxID=118510 RepID=A0A6L2K1N8_TANCI|nr:retrovirus-related Pol polyprotein from transposon TNT 1-94 [Tanacetum cinerariifolium]